jgi:hypothetical protein
MWRCHDTERPLMAKKKQRKLVIARSNVTAAIDYIVQGLFTDGAHHKQYYLEQAARVLGVDDDILQRLGYERGIPS